MWSLLHPASPHDLSPPLPFGMTPVLSLSSSPPNPKVCRRVEEHLETGWAAAGAKLSAELVSSFLRLEKSSWYLTEQKKRAGLNQDPVLQVCDGKLVHKDWAGSGERLTTFNCAEREKSEMAKELDIALWRGTKHSADTTPLKRDLCFDFSKNAQRQILGSG